MKRTQAIELPEEEIAKQKEWMAAFAALEDRPHTYCVVTYGCQMNAHDSEKLEGMLTQMGMTPAANREEADFVIFNTCCVRDNARAARAGQRGLAQGAEKDTSGVDGRRLRLHDAAAGDGRADSQAISVCGSGLRHA